MKNYKDLYKQQQSQQESISCSNSKQKIQTPSYQAQSKAKSPLSNLIYKSINLNFENLQSAKPKINFFNQQNNNNNSNIANQSSNQTVNYKPAHKASCIDSNIVSKIIKRQQPLSQPQSILNSPRNSPQKQQRPDLNQFNNMVHFNGPSKENKPISFLNYLLMKEIAQRSKLDDLDTSSNTNNNNVSKTPIQQEVHITGPVNKNHFNLCFVIGKGGFGKVWKVEQRKSKQLFAMKEMSKSLIITKKSVNSVMNERNLLAQLKHPFLVNMQYAFQDRDNLYLIMDLMPGGDLRFHIGRQRRFSEEQTKFFVACIFLGLEYLHNQNIIHRDIKPENLVLDQKGYVRITDLGIARVWKPDNANDTSGTPGYMAPEVMCRQPHTFAVDYFALGVLAYEFMLGRRPYLGRSRKEIRDQILAKRVQIKKQEIPDGWSLEAADFINRLIERKPSNRLGINGPAEVKNHPWIRNYQWQKLYNKEIDAPFLPGKEDNFDHKQQLSDDEQNTELIQQNAMLLKRPSVQSLFNGYNYDSFNPTANNNVNGCNTSNINFDMQQPSFMKSQNASTSTTSRVMFNQFMDNSRVDIL